MYRSRSTFAEYNSRLLDIEQVEAAMHMNSIHTAGSMYERSEERLIITVAVATAVALALFGAFFLLWPL